MLLRNLTCLLLFALLALPAPAVNGLMGYWPMDEGTGAIVDECSGSAMGSEGLAIGTVNWETTARGPAIKFDGKSTAVKIPSNPNWDFGEGELTIGLWVKIERGSAGFILDHYFSGTAGVWGLVMEGGPTFALYNDAKKPVKLKFGDFRYGEWQYLTVVWKRAKGGWLKGYLNGKPANTLENVDCAAKYPFDLYVGGRQGIDQFSTGNYRDLAIFNRALSDDEIGDIYLNGMPFGSPVVISSLHTDKLLYAPRDTGAASIRVKNLTDLPRTTTLAVDIISESNQRRTLPPQTIEIPPHTTKPVTVPLRFEGETYGCEVRARVVQDGKTLAEKRDFFSVAENFFTVGIGSDWGGGLHTASEQYRTIPESARKMYSNWFELFFWSPCDWALHVAPQKQWWSGQASYPEDEDHLTDLIKKSHEQGIKVAMYANANPAGPFGWDVARKHPEWFGGGGFGRASLFNADALDNWNNPAWRKNVKGNPGWYVIPVDLRRTDALDYGIDRIVDSAKQYGWDAVRYDGHYTIVGNDEMSTRNMRRLKERTQQQLPGFRLGFNYGRAPEWLGGVSHEMREGMAGGNLYLQEGIRNWRYTGDQYASWKHYATNELRIAKLVQQMGGTYHCMWTDNRLTPSQAYYKLVYGLIAGGHPADSGIYATTPGCALWGAFMTRWSSMLWHLNLRTAPAEKARFTVDNPAVQWTDFVQERVVSPTRKYVVLHLVNPPPADEIAKTAFPDPLKEFAVAYTPPAGQKVVGVRLVRPDLLPFDTDAALQMKGNRCNVTVSGLQHWAMLVWEVQGRFTVPTATPAFTEPPDRTKLVWSPLENLVIRTDPNKEELSENVDPNDIIVSLATGGVNIGKVVTTDNDSPQNSVQWRNKEKASGKMGKWWTGPYSPGKYRVSIRLKWTDANANPTPQTLTMQVMAEKGEKLIKDPVVFVTPHSPNPPAGAITLGERGKYQTYEFGAIDIKQTEYFTFDGTAATATVGDNSLYGEKIIVHLVERYTDAQLAELNNIDKPAGLRTPNGAQPRKALLVKGLFSNLYNIEQSVKCDTAYALPKTYEDLYAYDTLILCNMDLRLSVFPARKMINDFVNDGGRLVILGGNRTLGEGGMPGTYFETLSPFALKGLNEVQPCTPPVLLGATAGTPYPEKPTLFWRHNLTLAPGATVLAYAGKDPLAAQKKTGNGQVIVFTGTVLGEGTAQAKPFWECASWKTLLTRMVVGK
ncbi:MAG: LamG domain-containing protein [Armatimonadota bacterium]